MAASISLLVFFQYLLVAISLLEDSNWLLAATVHFQPYVLIFNLVLLFIAVAAIKKPYIFLLCLLPTLYFAWNTYTGTRLVSQPLFEGVSEKPRLKIAFVNINSENPNKHMLVEMLQKENTDIALLAEVSPQWESILSHLTSLGLHYSKLLVRRGNFGIGILSKYPFTAKSIYPDQERLFPAMIANFKVELEEITVGVLHAFPPIGQNARNTQRHYLETLATVFQKNKGPLIVCGDFNLTPWSSLFRAFSKVSNLKISNRVVFPNTWPTDSLFPSIPIDHCLTKKVLVTNYRRGPKVGSDHWPILLKTVGTKLNE